MPENVEQVVSGLYAAYNAGDADAASALYAPTGRHLEVATGRRGEGPAEIGAGLAGFLRAFPDAHWEERVRVLADGRAAVSYLLTGTLQDRLGPFEPAGQSLELRGVHVLDIGPQGIEFCEDYWDAATFGRQMQSDQVAPG
jgi:hypothetical protein